MKFQSIQALRAIAANAVLIAHLTVIERKYNRGALVLPKWVEGGVFGVVIFFVVSGFIMASLAERNSKRFLINRTTRIFPPYWFYTTLVLAAALIRPDWVNSSYDQAPSIWRSYLLVPDTTFPILGVGWTLIHEMYFYIVFALVIAIRLPQVAAIAAWTVVILLIWLLFPGEAGSPAYPILSTAVNPLTFEFMAGILVSLALRRFNGRLAVAILTTGALGLTATVMFYPEPISLTWGTGLWWRLILIGLPCAAVVYGIAGLDVKRAISFPAWVIRLGDASYSTYLAHVLVASALGRALMQVTFGGVLYEVILVAICIVAANLFGLISHALIEQPTVKIGRGLFRMT